jgi:hypothetical protein
LPPPRTALREGQPHSDELDLVSAEAQHILVLVKGLLSTANFESG